MTAVVITAVTAAFVVAGLLYLFFRWATRGTS